MNPNNAVELRRISKSFKVKTAGEGRFLRKERRTILESIDLDIPKGQVLGIIGKNGSGKSTLLKIISRIMKPNGGQILVNGRIASVLELGMGFHPDMSGRDNILLKGQMYGFRKKDILSRMEEIIDYTGIRPFIDNPVRTYSSGMLGRLAFAVMINVDADILLVDEVLSVGDVEFSTKAMEHFNKITRSGKTVLLVSHDLGTLTKMCHRVIWIDKGHIIMDGDSESVVNAYLGNMTSSVEVIRKLAEADVPDAQYQMACHYHTGEGGEIDDGQYIYWLKRAASNGHAISSELVSEILFNSKDPDERLESVEYYMPRANAGDLFCRHRISQVLGKDDMDSVSEVVTRMKELADAGYPYSQLQYARYLETVAERSSQYPEIIRWYTDSMDGGNAEAAFRLFEIYREGKSVKQDPESARMCLIKAAEMGYPPAMKALRECYLRGDCVTQDYMAAFEWTRRAAQRGISESYYDAAYMMYLGIGTEVDRDSSIHFFECYSISKKIPFMVDSARSLLRSSPENAGRIYQELAGLHAYEIMADLKAAGRCDLIDRDSSVRLLEEMCSAYGSPRVVAAEYYLEGMLVERDVSLAIGLLEHSFAQGDCRAARMLSEIRSEGLGEKHDAEYYRIFSEAYSTNTDRW